MSLLSGILNIIKKVYIYVPPCPCCGSLMTGRFVKKHNKRDDSWIMEESLKNGELICIVPDVQNTAFCLNCEYTWNGRIKTVFMNRKQICDERMNRHTEEILYDITTTEEQKQKDKRKNAFSRMLINPIKKYVGTK